MSHQSDQLSVETSTTSAIVPAGIPGVFIDRSPSNAAFEKRLDEIQSVDDDALAPLNLDVREAIITVFRALRGIAPHKEAISTLAWIDQN